MFRLFVFFFFFSIRSVKCDNSLNLISFNGDYDKYEYFTGNKCINEREWKLVSYDSLNIKSFNGNYKGFLAVDNACATSLPIDFFDGIIEVTVYVQAASKKFNLLVDVWDEYDKPILCYRYGSSSVEYTPGWQRIYLRINSRARGYINIRGRSAEGETVLMDSFLYKPDVQEIYYRNKRSINYESDEEPAIEIDRNIDNQKYIRSIPGANDSFWNPFIIFFVTFAVIFGLLFVAVCGYHIGKMRRKKNKEIPSRFTDDIEPPSTIIIPRVKIAFKKISLSHRKGSVFY